jgi:hypothetical protein
LADTVEYPGFTTKTSLECHTSVIGLHSPYVTLLTELESGVSWR